jgi:hypothetical protein
VLGCSSRAQRAALSKRAGLWSSGVAAWAVASQGAFNRAVGATEEAEELIDVGKEEGCHQRETDQQHRHHDLLRVRVRGRGRGRGRATSEGDTRLSGRT